MGATFHSLTVSSSKPKLDASGDIDITSRDATPEELERAAPLSQNEFNTLVASKEYKQSKLVQQLAIAGRKKGQDHEAELESHPYNVVRNRQEAVAMVGDLAAAERSAAMSMFRSPEYKNNPAYRHAVVQKISDSITELPQGKTHRLSWAKEGGQGIVNHTAGGVYRATAQSSHNLGGPDKPTKPEPKPSDPNVVDLYFDR
jgi:hypothetical protein